MKLIDRYVVKTVLQSLALVLLILIGLQAFILVASQVGDIGKSDFGIAQALVYVGLEMPYQVYLFFPMASLLGCLIGLGTLASSHELIVLRAAGMSIGQIIIAVFKIAMVLVVMMSVLGEMVLPKMVLWANEYKRQALSGGNALQTSKGMWFHTGHDILMIGAILSPTELQQIDQFHFDEHRHLLFVRHIQALSKKGGIWQASKWEQTNFSQSKLTVEHVSDVPWDVKLNSHLLQVSQQEPDEMTLMELHQFLAAQKSSCQNVRNYELGYWQRLVLPFTTMVMMLLAIPCIFGPLRSSSMGSKLMFGAVIGFGFYILNRFCGFISQIYQFSALMAAIGPTAFFAGLGLYWMYRT